MKICKLQIRNTVFASLLLVAPLTACNEDFIDLLPPSAVTVEVLYQTEDDFKQAMVGVYTGLRSHYGGFWEIGDLRADDVWQEATNQTARVLTDNFQGHTVSARATASLYRVIFC
jgi:hypothetical protein